ncbi:MAG: glycosyltransferase family 39 protein [Deltaproteobacteria bacterium]|nr:glycosyltransferase family 39 protein [Deltaproteobacteria bacterium]
MNVVEGLWGDLFSHLKERDVHPPLYFVLTKGLGAVAGFDEIGLRLLSVIAGTCAPLFAFLLGRKLWNRRSGLIAASLVAVSPFCVYYAREARGYSLLLCLSLAATWLFFRAAPLFRLRPLAAYTAVAALLPLVHVFGFFTLAAHGLGAALLVLERRAHDHGDRATARRLIVAAVFVALAYLPWLPATCAQVGRVGQGFWVPRPHPATWFHSWVGEGVSSWAWVIGTVLAALATLWRWTRKSPALFSTAVAGLLFPCLLPIALSYVVQPFFMPKYAIAASGLTLVLAAGSLAERRCPWPRLTIGLLLAIGAGETIRDVHSRKTKEQWRELAAHASYQAVELKVPLVMTVHFATHLRHYLDPRAPLWPVGHHELITPGPDGLAQKLAAAGKDRFWLLNIHPDQADPALAPLFLQRWVPVDIRRWLGTQAVLWVDAKSIPGHSQ